MAKDRKVPGIEGISDLRDESDRDGMRIIIELKRDARPQQIIGILNKHTAMRSAFSVNMLALIDGQPRVLTLKMALLHYLNYRKQVLTRRVCRVRLAGEYQLHRLFAIGQQPQQPLGVMQQEIRSLVGCETPGKTQSQKIGIKQTFRLIDLAGRRARCGELPR